VLKHTMAVRPVFHWTIRRVRAHIAICFAVLAMLRILRRHYNIRHGGQASLSEGQILAELREVEVSVVRDNTTKRHYAIPAAASSTKIRLYKAMGHRPTDARQREVRCALSSDEACEQSLGGHVAEWVERRGAPEGKQEALARTGPRAGFVCYRRTGHRAGPSV